jgi:integrase
MNIALPKYEPQTITLALIRKLTKANPPARPKEIRDKQHHLILRHQPTGYLGLYVELGRGKRERLCNAGDIADPAKPVTLGKMRARALSMRGQSADGRDYQRERAEMASIPTLGEYLKGAYSDWAHNHRRSANATIGRLKSRFPKLQNTRLDAITPDKLEPWKARRIKEVTHETINRDIAALRAALARSVRLRILNENPLAGVEMMEVDRNKQSVRALSAEEKTRLVTALMDRDDTKRAGRVSVNQWRKERGYDLKPTIGQYCDVLTPAVITSLETGLRRGELFALEWTSVDFESKTLRVEGNNSKTYETRDMPLNKVAHQTLRDWWLQMGQPRAGPVFTLDGAPIGSLRKSYYKVLDDAEIERVNERDARVNWHSLRHTFGTLLGAANVDPTTLMKLMGHAKLSTTQRYLHTDAERKRAAVELLDALA